ncbi:3-oxoacyl-[acyl-carrier-protein] reductase [bacterium]|nr:3-oxoacyl-[acyl-carrier-protein] reductase [bacterium]MCI0604064.1 3-oxoacyl-[acyl-carrier-protein] reductase [bacterium]
MLTNRVTVVTGATRGIGEAIAIAAAKNGSDVALWGRNEDLLQKTKQRISELGRKAEAYRVDVARQVEVDEAMKKVLQDFSRIDFLVNNAGITRDNLLLTMKPEEWDQVLQTNLYGTFYCSKAVLRSMMKQRYGKIVNISSIAGITGNPGQTNYSASKAGMIGFTKSLAKEMGKRNICVNTIAPGMIETEMTQMLPEELKKQYLELIPLGRFGKVEEVAALVLFLLSSASDYITGQVFAIDGGLQM